MKLIKFSFKSEAIWILLLSLTPFVVGLMVFILQRLWH